MRAPTTKISDFKIHYKQTILNIFDVVGQKEGRKAWIHFLESEISSIIFVSSIAAYDQTMDEDSSKNVMEDSMDLFHEIANNPFLEDIPIILLLNKMDLFEQKIEFSSISTHFPDFEGNLYLNLEAQTLERSKNFFMRKFQDLLIDDDRAFFTHFTTNIDSKVTTVLIPLIFQIIIENNIKAFGII